MKVRCLTVVLSVLTAVLPALSAEKVRVAFREDAGYAQFGKNGERCGYFVDWMNRVALALDLEIEWVDVPWGRMRELVASGRVDIVPSPANITELGDALVVGHMPISYWRMCLFALNGSLLEGVDYRILDGTVIGVPKSHPATRLLIRSFEECGVKFRVKEYSDRASLERSLFAGDTGAIFSEATDSLRFEKLLFTLPAVPLYFAVPKGREELLERIDRVVASIADGEPEFIENLRARYFHGDRSSKVIYTAAELDWLSRQKRDHRVFKVDVTPIDGYFKVADSEDAAVTGCAKALLDEISEVLGLSFAVDSARNHDGMEQRLKDGEVDMAMPYGCREFQHRHTVGRSGVVLSVPVPQAVCTRRFTSVDLQGVETKIAVARSDGARMLAYRDMGLMPKLLICDSVREAFKAVENGEADCLISDYPVIRRVVEEHPQPEKFDVRISYNFRYRPTFPIVMSPVADPMLVEVLAKTVGTITADRMVALADHSAARQFRRSISLKRILAVVVPVFSLMLGLAVVVLYLSRRRTRRLLRRSEVSLQMAQDSIEEQVRIRNKLKEAAERAEFAAKSKTNFLATMSHEIRTPLNAVVGYSEFLADPTVTPDKVREYARGISLSANALLSLINDVLDISKFESGRREGLDLRNGDCDLKSLLEEMHTVFRLRCQNKGIAIEFAIDPCFPRLVISEPRFRQILLNLIGNAVKFTDRGRVRVEAKYQDGELICSVDDTGIGITERGKKYIFDPFSQDMESRRGKIYAGTGLGLSIVKRLVESSGGTISVDSVVGKGSCFTVKIPDVKISERKRGRNRSTENGGMSGDEAPVDHEIRSVVIVDDMQLNRQILLLHCKSLGLDEIEVFSSGAEVIEHLVAGHHPDVILTDMWMPGMDGSHLAKTVSERWPDIPVVAVTADTDPGTKFDISAFRAILSKPVTGPKLKKLFDEMREDAEG